MKKRILVLLCLLSLLLCPACGNRIAYSILGEEQDFPKKEDAVRALELLELDWTVLDVPMHPDIPGPKSAYLMSFRNGDGKIHCNYSFAPNPNRRTLSFIYESELGAEYDRFLLEEMPRLWSLCSLFCPGNVKNSLSSRNSSRPAEAADLAKACLKELDHSLLAELDRCKQADPLLPDTVFCRHRVPGSSCRMDFLWSPEHGRYLLSKIEVEDDDAALKKAPEGSIKSLAEIKAGEEQAFVQGWLAPPEEEMPPLSALEAAKAGLPMNTADYEKCCLLEGNPDFQDGTEASLPVYVSPACKYESGLYALCVLPGPCYVLSFSTSNYGIGK
ncbi:MAG: hypothetical protein Q4B50_08375 [Bacillota bacterium]|nr:hypothetical protein [Bacillota bacterium]